MTVAICVVIRIDSTNDGHELKVPLESVGQLIPEKFGSSVKDLTSTGPDD